MHANPTSQKAAGDRKALQSSPTSLTRGSLTSCSGAGTRAAPQGLRHCLLRLGVLGQRQPHRPTARSRAMVALFRNARGTSLKMLSKQQVLSIHKCGDCATQGHRLGRAMRSPAANPGQADGRCGCRDLSQDAKKQQQVSPLQARVDTQGHLCRRGRGAAAITPREPPSQPLPRSPPGCPACPLSPPVCLSHKPIPDLNGV